MPEAKAASLSLVPSAIALSAMCAAFSYPIAGASAVTNMSELLT
jgi:hypothetical protein